MALKYDIKTFDGRNIQFVVSLYEHLARSEQGILIALIKNDIFMNRLKQRKKYRLRKKYDVKLYYR